MTFRGAAAVTTPGCAAGPRIPIPAETETAATLWAGMEFLGTAGIWSRETARTTLAELSDCIFGTGFKVGVPGGVGDLKFAAGIAGTTRFANIAEAC